MSPQKTRLQASDNLHVRRVSAYGETDGRPYVAVDGQIFTQSLVLTLEEVRDWPPQAFAEITPQHIALLLEHNPELVLLGTGVRQQFPASSLSRVCEEKGVGFEVMTTPAACRTYNLLAGEDRLVVAALLMEG